MVPNGSPTFPPGGGLRLTRQRRRRFAAAALVLLVALPLIADLTLPEGIAGGVPYVLAVIASAWLRREGATLALAALCTLLSVLGFLASPENFPAWEAWAARGVGIGLLWMTAALVILLLRAHRRFELALEAMPQAVVLSDEPGTILLANARADELFGYPPRDLVGRNVTELVPERRRVSFVRERAEFFQRGAHSIRKPREHIARLSDGRELPVEVTLHALETDRGVVLLTTVVDVSHRQRLEQDKDRLVAIVQTSSDAIVSVDVDGTVTSWNAGAEAIYGRTADEMIGLPLWVVAPSEREGEMRRLVEVLAEGTRVRNLETEHVGREGDRLRIALSASPVRDAQGKVVGAATIARDVTAQKRSESLLVEMNLALTNAMPGHAYVGPRGAIATANEALADLLGAVASRAGRDWREGFHPADREKLDAAYETMLKDGKAELTARLSSKPSSEVVASVVGEGDTAEPPAEELSEETSALPIDERYVDVLLVRRSGPAGRFQGHHLLLKDVTARERAEVRLRDLAEALERSNDDLARLAQIDPLTGLMNRRGLDHFLRAESHRAYREGSSLVAILVDLDDFKSFNERYGHLGGDQVLSSVATRLRQVSRAYDGTARIGGDEFLLVLPGTRLAEARIVAERLRSIIAEEPIRVPATDGGESLVHVTCSLGVAEVTEADPSIPSILLHTRAALQQSKSEGKDRVSGVPGKASEEDELLRVLEEDRIVVVHQGIFDLREARVVGEELLCRGPHGPYRSPVDLFSACAARELLPRADLACLRRVVRAAHELPADRRLHVNVYPQTLLSEGPEAVLEVLHALPEDRSVCIEINEHAFVGAPSKLEGAVAALRAAGHQIALDDIGFGKSALETLAVLEPDIVKLDRRVLADAPGDAARTRTLDRLLSVVYGLRATPIAEGVEREEDRALLLSLGVRLAQGFLLARPHPVSGFADRDVLLPYPAPGRVETPAHESPPAHGAEA